MASSTAAREFRSRIERIEALIRDVEHFADPAVPSSAQELLRTVIELHGAALGAHSGNRGRYAGVRRRVDRRVRRTMI